MLTWTILCGFTIFLFRDWNRWRH